VTAYHKRAKLLSRGHVLTADYNRGIYRVQFERPELGSEICMVRNRFLSPPGYTGVYIDCRRLCEHA
jgi:hypothetical protein